MLRMPKIRPKPPQEEPMAWVVFMPEGHEYDYMVYARKYDAYDAADEINSMRKEDDKETTSPIPLYPR